MRPLKITMTAFGPYKHREVINFTELKDNRLFVVSGNTGAGKTTIFDAICFALYGSASGEDRSDPKLMRSDFAEDDVHTAVELEFELHDRIYRILRQLPHVKQGNKGATGERYEFYERVDDRELPCVDRQIVSEINKRVEELVGLSKDQFSQIVMLPQGEFRKLLTSQTENKEEILRKIFRTEPYKWISERLKEKKKVADEEFKREVQARDRYINNIGATLPLRDDSKLFEVLAQEHFNTNQVISGLEEDSAYYQQKIENNKSQAEIANIVHHQKLEEYHKAKALNERFMELEDKMKKHQHLSEQAPIFKEKEKQLENAERASHIELYEAQVNEWREDEKVKNQEKIVANAAHDEAEKQLSRAQKEYVIEENKKVEREEISRNLDRFLDFLPIVKEIDSKNTELSKVDKNVQTLSRELERIQVSILKEKTAKETLTNEIKRLDVSVGQLAEKQWKLTELRDKARVLKDYLTLYKFNSELDLDFQKKKQSYLLIKEHYDRKEEAWISGQASILAAHLHDGKPCPVCGSHEHPNKANSQDAVPTKEELEAAKKELDKKDGEYRDALAKLNSNMEQLEDKAAKVAEIGFVVDSAEHIYNQIVKEGKELAKEVDVLGKERETLAELKKMLDKTEKELEQLELKKDEHSKAYQDLKTDFETKKAVYVEQISRIPEEIRILSVLEQKISETQTLKLKLENAWESAGKQYQLAKENEAKATVHVSNAIKHLDESNAKKNRAEKQFQEALIHGDFASEDEYRKAKMSEPERQQLKNEIAEFNKLLNTIKQQVIELQEALKDETKADLDVLNSEVVQLKNAYDHAIDVLRHSEQCLEKSLDLKARICEAEENVSDLEKQLAIISDLYDVVRGQNSSKISFERYLQIEFLEQIIIAANERLKRLSNGQFLLMRSDRQESRGKQSGLGLDVFDAYTGQTRDVKSLSGGEKFNASLCLALGMADVIQSFQGGVSIDTMFIDEGFGSLDEESLNKAIDTLIDLQQSGRMIGVISHVQELKNTIPAILEVKKTKEGYSQTQFIIK